MISRQTCQRCRSYRYTVIAFFTGDDFGSLRLSGCSCVIANELDQCVIGVGARVTQEHLSVFYRYHGRQFIGELYRRWVRLATKHMAKTQLTHLPGSYFNNLFVAVAQGSAPEARHTL